ncbi:MAG: cupin-like domain-containing protein [Sphingobium sp.]
MTDILAFDDASRDALAAAYPETPAIVPHRLLAHPLLTLESLAELGARLPAKSVEYNSGTLPIGVDPAATPGNGLGIEETIRSIEQNGSWMVLKNVEQDPGYAALLNGALAEIVPVIDPVTGPMDKLEAFIFVSSPNAVTPFHFDPEHNILLQIRGSKTMTVFPADDAELASHYAHEAFHRGEHHRNLPWQEAFAAKGKAFTLAPGDAIHVPVKAPHWVQNGPDVSISLSVTWRSDWSLEEADARLANHYLRKLGLDPSAPGRFPQRNRTKAIVHRAYAKAVRTIKGA